MSAVLEKWFAPIFGAVLLVALLVIAVVLDDPPPFAMMVFRVALALAAAAVVSFLPGSLDIVLAPGLRAGGSVAVFVLVYFANPAEKARDFIYPDYFESNPKTNAVPEGDPANLEAAPTD